MKLLFSAALLFLLTFPSVAQTPEENALRIDELTTAVCNAHPADPLCNLPPVANAGPDQDAETGQIVTLDGSLSSDPNPLDTLTYAWVLSRPPESMSTLSDTTAITPDFTPDIAGTYVGSLTVNDGTVDSAVDTVSVTVTDPITGPVLIAEWIAPTIPQEVGPIVWPTSYKVKFTNVNITALVPGGYGKLASWASDTSTAGHLWMVSDSNLHSGGTTSSFRFRLCSDGATVQYFAGSYTVGVPFDLEVTFDGAEFAASKDDVEFFRVSQPGLPCNDPNVDGALGGQPATGGGGSVLQGTMGSVEVFDTTVQQGNQAPTAAINVASTVTTGNQVTLDGSVSTDPENNPLTYAWVMTSKPPGSTAVLSDPNAAMPTFTADLDGAYVNELTVDDGEFSDVASATVTASATPPSGLSALCDLPGNLVCEGFENGENWSFFKPGLGSVPPQVVCGNADAAFEGDCALQITHDRGAGGPDVGGSVAYDFPANSVYVYFRMKSNGLIKQLGTFNGSNGSKFVQVVEGTGSCSSDSVNLNDNWSQRAVTLANSCGGLLWRIPTLDGDKNYQPIGAGDTANFSANCTRRHLGGTAGYQNPPRPDPADLDAYNGPCVIYRDDRWFEFEIKMFVNEAVKLWVDDGDGNGLELVIDLLNPDSGSPITEPRRRIFFQSYKTDYDGSGGAGKWEVWYDNFVVSRECIRSCGL